MSGLAVRCLMGNSWPGIGNGDELGAVRLLTAPWPWWHRPLRRRAAASAPGKEVVVRDHRDEPHLDDWKGKGGR